MVHFKILFKNLTRFQKYFNSSIEIKRVCHKTHVSSVQLTAVRCACRAVQRRQPLIPGPGNRSSTFCLWWFARAGCFTKMGPYNVWSSVTGFRRSWGCSQVLPFIHSTAKCFLSTFYRWDKCPMGHNGTGGFQMLIPPSLNSIGKMLT